ncbi:hypothetical protein [Sphingomonas sp. RB1R13]|uniref:hypothetical protein n=1 Tax=Sphingomonas sp. RB1R13 TaxID=3096159 RepID=UPI002FC89C4F
MPRPTSPHQLAAFVGALVETGNVTLSAERVGLAKSGIYKRRARDSGFDRMCRDAIADFDVGSIPDAPDHFADPAAARTRKHELVHLPAHAGRPAQLRRSPGGALKPSAMAIFLAHLGETANVRGAARAAGIAHSSILRRQHRDPAFAAAMAEAIDIGGFSLEAALNEAALVFLDPAKLDPTRPPLLLPSMSVKAAIDIVNSAHRRKAMRDMILRQGEG